MVQFSPEKNVWVFRGLLVAGGTCGGGNFGDSTTRSSASIDRNNMILH